MLLGKVFCIQYILSANIVCNIAITNICNIAITNNYECIDMHRYARGITMSINQVTITPEPSLDSQCKSENNVYKNFRHSLVALAIGSTACAMPNMAFAAESTDAVEKVERIQVTGSRIKRVDTVGAVPVNIIDASFIEKAGFSTVAEVLQFSTFNAEGSNGNSANNTWSSQQTVEIRGQSLFHTLILIDGQRMSKSPILDGGASSINDLPLAAVERIEILTDGASAVYGSDAIAGVVNIILKKEFEGVEVKVNAERAEINAGDRNSFSFVTGTTTEKSSSLFVYEHDERDAIGYADLDYAKARVVNHGPTDNPNDIANIWGYSNGGRVITRENFDFDSPQTDNKCDSFGPAFAAGPFVDAEYPDDVICRFDYTQQAGIRPVQNRDNVLASYTYHLSDEITLNARAYWAHMNTVDVSAPASSSFAFGSDLPEVGNLTAVSANDRINYRFTDFGPRTADTNNDIQDISIGLVGSTDLFDWDFSYGFNRYTSRVFGTNYLNTGNITDSVGTYNADTGEVDGWDPRDANSKAPQSLKANFDRHLQMKQQGLNGGVGFEFAELEGGSIGVYVGASYREEFLKNFLDIQADIGNVAGGSGGSAGSSERDIFAVFTEAYFPIFEDLTLNLAGRYDDYSDFGDTFNPQVSVRYAPTDDLVLRASWGTGFRAPTLVDINQESAIGFINVIDYVQCLDKGYIPGGSTEDCTVQNVPVDTSGNTELTPEESVTWNVGAAYNITDDFYAKVDYWNISLEDIIGAFSADDVVFQQARLIHENSSLDVGDVFPGIGLTQNGRGQLDSVRSKNINFGESDRRGMDVEIGYKVETEYGDFSSVINWAHTFEYTESQVDRLTGTLVEGNDLAGRVERPDDIVNLSLSWVYDNHTLSTFTSFYDAQQNINEDGEIGNELPSWSSTNVTYRLELEWNAAISFKVLNAFDRKVPLRSFQNDIIRTDYRLYPLRGRALAVSYTHSF